MTRVETSAVQPVGVGITIRYRWRRRARSCYPRCAPGTWFCCSSQCGYEALAGRCCLL